jgi:hypothetical protein
VSAPAALGAECELHLDVAGRPLTIEACDDEAVAAVRPALGHLMTGRRVATATRFRIWCDDERAHPLWEADAPGPLRLGDRGLAMSHPSPAMVELFDPGRGLELWGTRVALAGGDTRAHPGGTATAAWLATEGAQVLHVGAVVFDHTAVLLIGSGGAGKSTTTVACGLAGAGILGDDMCVVDFDRETRAPTVHALYSTLKLNPDSDARLGAEGWPSLGTTPKGKRVLAIEAPLRLHASAPVGAILALRPPGRAPTVPTRLTPGAAVGALLPTALNSALGAGDLDGWFAMALRLAQSVPAYELSLSWNLEHLVGSVAATIASSG